MYEGMCAAGMLRETVLTEACQVSCVHRRGLGQINRHAVGVVLVRAIRVDDGNAVAVELLLVDEVTE